MNKLLLEKKWKYAYVILISYIFYSSILCNLYWKSDDNLFHLLIDYHDEFIVLIGLLFYIREVIKILKNIIEKNYKNISSLLVPIILITLVYIGCGNKRYFVYAISIYESKECNYLDIVKIYFYAKLLGTITWLGLYGFNYLVVEENARNAMTLGMYSYNDVAYTIIYELLAGWYLYCTKRKWVFVLITLLLGYILYFYVKSRTAFIMSIPIMYMICSADKEPAFKRNKKNKYIFEYFPLIMLISAILLGLALRFLYIKTGNVPLGGFSSRFTEIALQMHYGEISLFPAKLLEWREMYFDNTFGNFIFKRGLIVTFIFIYLAIKNNKKILENNNSKLVLLSLFVYVYGQMEYVVKGEILILLLMFYYSKNDKSY